MKKYIFIVLVLVVVFVNIPALWGPCAWYTCPDAGRTTKFTGFPNFYTPAGEHITIAGPVYSPASWSFKMLIFDIVLIAILAFIFFKIRKHENRN